MRKNNRSGYEQAYNAQAVVDATGSMLVLGARVSNVGPDSGQLAIDIDAIPTELGMVTTVIADTGYASGEPVQDLQSRGMEVGVIGMRKLLESERGQQIYKLRKQSVAYNLKRLAALRT